GGDATGPPGVGPDRRTRRARDRRAKKWNRRSGTPDPASGTRPRPPGVGRPRGATRVVPGRIGRPREVSVERTPPAGTVRVQFIGNATLLIRYGALTLLTDPNFLHRGQLAHLGYGLVSRRLT